ncbi:hypothetical protein DPMN_051909 [Dreissena polymorpha]|uniref:Uncharacterized protein n=1 Tax=Dreissena polymorpha TaxID=45954 RepID=A0A9D4HNT2_DREPO|nr:hypothetical protein DPMN_051909 [Dreissena polymorpha]
MFEEVSYRMDKKVTSRVKLHTHTHSLEAIRTKIRQKIMTSRRNKRISRSAAARRNESMPRQSLKPQIQLLTKFGEDRIKFLGKTNRLTNLQTDRPTDKFLLKDDMLHIVTKCHQNCVINVASREVTRCFF